MTRQFLSLIVTLASLVAIGSATGVITDRWGVPVDVLTAADRLGGIPSTIAGWTGQDQEIDQRQLDGAGALGHLSRVYLSPDRAHLVSVTLLCGRHGPISLHEPTVCFTASGMRQLSAERSTTFEHGTNRSSFWNTEFSLPKPGEPAQRTFWGWSTDVKQWNNPANPRMNFADAKLLYKIYFVTPISEPRAGTQAETDPQALQFISSFLEQLPGYLHVDAPKQGPSASR